MGCIFWYFIYKAVPGSLLIEGAENKPTFADSGVHFLFVLLGIGNVYFTR
jgi:hypothetical protein